ncbi:hypothetical protein HCC57_04950 [Streptococcus suis]|nr:hypothetical protein [Streptococcus suis]
MVSKLERRRSLDLYLSSLLVEILSLIIVIILAIRDKNILRLVVKKSPTGESTHYFFHSQDDKVEVSC